MTNMLKQAALNTNPAFQRVEVDVAINLVHGRRSHHSIEDFIVLA